MEITEILSLNIEELKQKLEERNLPSVGNKADLQARLINSEMNLVNIDNMEQESCLSQLSGTSVNQVQQPSQFSFRDIEESITCFHGEGKDNVVTWIDEYEKISNVIGWSELQKFIFAKRLLKGPAKLYVNGIRNVTSWVALKESLLAEFVIEINSADIHKNLSDQRKKSDESLREFAYRIVEIGKIGKLEDNAIIDYIIKGINERGAEGYMLYGAGTLSEFMKKLSLYEKVKQNNKPWFKINEKKSVENSNRYNNVNNKYNNVDTREIVRYEPRTHVNRNEQTNQLKCYQCGEIGHKAMFCRNKVSKDIKKEVNTITADKNRICVQVNDVETTALVDSGSEVSLIKLELFNRMNIRNHFKANLVIVGIGGESETLGYCLINVKVQGYTYKVKVYVIKDEVMSIPVILGMNFFKVAKVMFKNNRIVVAPTRLNKKTSQVNALSREVQVCEVTVLHQIREAQDSDSYVQAVKTIIFDGSEYDGFFMKKGVIYRMNNDSELLVIPEAMENEIIKQAHEQGHFAAKKTEEIIKREYYIKNCPYKVEKYIKNCVHCILVEGKTGKQEGFLHPIPKEDQPLQTLHVDHLRIQEATLRKYKYILIVIDAFTKFTWLYPTRSTSSDEVILHLKRQAATFGNPKRIISDRGTAFTSTTFKEYCKREDVQHHEVTTGVPRGNGQVERINRVVVPMITKLSLGKPNEWFKYVGDVQQYINSSVSRATQFSPFRLMFGVEMKINIKEEASKLYKAVEEEIVRELDDNRAKLRSEAAENIKKVQAENKKTYDGERKPANTYKMGDLVAMRRTQMTQGKLIAKYLGPYEIVKEGQNERYEIKKIGMHEGPNNTSAVADHLKPWRGAHDSIIQRGNESDYAKSTYNGRGRGVGQTKMERSYSNRRPPPRQQMMTRQGTREHEAAQDGQQSGQEGYGNPASRRMSTRQSGRANARTIHIDPGEGLEVHEMTRADVCASGFKRQRQRVRNTRAFEGECYFLGGSVGMWAERRRIPHTSPRY